MHGTNRWSRMVSLMNFPEQSLPLPGQLRMQRLIGMFLLVEIAALICGYCGRRHPLGRAGAITSGVLLLGGIILFS